MTVQFGASTTSLSFRSTARTEHARIGRHLSVEGVTAFETDDLTGFDRQSGIEGVVPDVVDVLVRVVQFVINLVVRGRHDRPLGRVGDKPTHGIDTG